MRYLSLILLLSFSAPLFAETTRDRVSSITLDEPVLQLIDGTPFIHIGNMMYIGKQLRNMLFKEPSLYFALENTHKTIRELRQLEEQYEAEGKMDNEAQNAFQEALHQALHTFVEISKPYVEEIRAAKDSMLKIIYNWSVKRNRENTYLLAWAELDENEEEALFVGITDFHELESFVNDLSTFLADLIQNCPKSYAQFKQQHHTQS